MVMGTGSSAFLLSIHMSRRRYKPVNAVGKTISQCFIIKVPIQFSFDKNTMLILAYQGAGRQYGGIVSNEHLTFEPVR